MGRLPGERRQDSADRGQRLGGGLDIARWAAVLRDVAGQSRRARRAGPPHAANREPRSSCRLSGRPASRRGRVGVAPMRLRPGC